MIIILAMAAAIAGSPDGSQNAGPSAGGAAPAAKATADLDKVICRTEQVTGSHFDRRVCMTRGQWDQRTRDAEQLRQRINDVGQGAPAGGPMGGSGH